MCAFVCVMGERPSQRDQTKKRIEEVRFVPGRRGGGAWMVRCRDEAALSN